MRRMNMIGAMLGREPPAFEAILYEGEVEGGGTIVVAHDCCAGLLAQVELACDDSRSWATSPIARSSSRS